MGCGASKVEEKPPDNAQPRDNVGSVLSSFNPVQQLQHGAMQVVGVQPDSFTGRMVQHAGNAAVDHAKQRFMDEARSRIFG